MLKNSVLKYWDIGKEFTLKPTIIGLLVLFFFSIIYFILSLMIIINDTVFVILISVLFLTNHLLILFIMISVLKENNVSFSIRKYLISPPEAYDFKQIVLGFLCIISLSCIAKLNNTENPYLQFSNLFLTDSESSDIFIIFILADVFIIPVLEEIIWRGLLCDTSQHFGIKKQAFLNILCFQYLHLSLLYSSNWMIFLLFPILTLILFDMYKITKTLHLSIIIHMLYNFLLIGNLFDKYIEQIPIAMYYQILLITFSVYLILRIVSNKKNFIFMR